MNWRTIWQGKEFGKEPKYECKNCHRRFLTPQSLGAHVTVETRGENILEWAIGERRRWNKEGKKCNWCGAGPFYSPSALANHILPLHEAEIKTKYRPMLDTEKNQEGMV